MNKIPPLLRLLTVLAGLLSSGLYGAEIRDIRVWHAPDRSRIVFDMNQTVEFQVFSLEAPARVVIDLNHSSLHADIPATENTGQFIQQIRQGSPDGEKVRLVFDMAKPVRYFVRLLKPSSGYQYRLVVDFHPSSYDPDKPEQSIERAKQKSKREFVVVVDAGHGGEDPGALGKNSQEKNLVLQISQKLAKMINARPNMRAIMTRTGDYYVNLRNRSAIARRYKADMFISVHADAFTSPKARGASVYALSLRGATSEAARLLANQQNLSDLAGGVNLAGKDPQTAQTLLGLSMDKTIDQSLLFGREVLAELEKIGRIHSSRVEQAGFMVLKSPDVPSILVETGYITNPTEEKLLRSKEHQQRVATAILKGIDRYLAKNPGYFALN